MEQVTDGLAEKLDDLAHAVGRIEHLSATKQSKNQRPGPTRSYGRLIPQKEVP